MKKIENYIDGALVAPEGERYLDNYDPSTGEIYSLIPDSDENDVNKAVKAAQKAFPEWSALSSHERSNYLIRVADLIDKNLEKFALAESIDNGKPLKLAQTVDIPRASANFRFFATAVLHFNSDAHITDSKTINYTTREPVGVAGCISPWNLPLYLFTWKIAPALAVGNTVVAKPSEITPMTAYLLSELCIAAGLPKGVLNIVHGLGAKTGAAIVEHEQVPLITFTGGTATGRAIAKVAAPMFKKLSLELGGKNPNIIYADSDFDKALSTTMRSSFANQGQICLCGSRIFVERPIYEKFKEAFVAKTKKLTVGDPLEDSSKLGALVSKEHLTKVDSYVKLAQEEGGKILAGGKQLKLPGRCSSGNFYAPTIIEGLDYKCRTNQEEIFGPVVTITPFDSQEEVIEMANSTEYGLAATIWTENITKAHTTAGLLKSGVVWINCWLIRDLRTPFGGNEKLRGWS